MLDMLHNMMRIEINGDNLYHLLAWFFIYSFMGWIWETCYMSIKDKKFTNRGFVFGPCITLYGCGAMAVYVILKPLSGNIVLLYFAGLILATVLEYVTAVIMESIFHTSWWDYSNDKFNFQGRICLLSSLFWGVLSVLLFRVFQPAVTGFTDMVPIRMGVNILLLVIALYIIDFTTTCIGATNIAEKLKSINGVLDEFGEYVKKTRLSTSTEEIRERMRYYKTAVTRNAAFRRIARGERDLAQLVSKLPEVKDSLMEKYTDFKQKYLKAHKESGVVIRRFMRNYPTLGRGYSIRHKKKNETEAPVTKEEPQQAAEEPLLEESDGVAEKESKE